MGCRGHVRPFEATKGRDPRPMEEVMSGSRKMWCAAAAVVLGAGLLAGRAQADDTAHFTDVLKSHGYRRGGSEAIADGQACGASGAEIRTIMPVFEQCMRGKGWVLDRYQPDPPSRPVSGTLESYTDIHGDGTGHPRDDAALQSDTQLCRTRVGDDGSALFKQCMAGHGWKFLYTQHAPAQPHFTGQRGFASGSRPPAPSYDSDPSYSSNPSTGPDTAGMNTPTNPTWPGFSR